MAFSSSAMEAAWATLMASIADTEWIDIISSTTGEYYRLPVSVGGLRHWNRTTGVWESVANPGSLIAVMVRTT